MYSIIRVGWLGGTDERLYVLHWCLAKPSAHERFQATIPLLTLAFLNIYSQLLPCHHHVIHPGDFTFLQPCFNSGSISPILCKSIIFSTCFTAGLLIWPKKTTRGEIPVANPIVQVNHTPVRGAIYRLGMRIWVSTGLLRAFNYWIFFFSVG